MARRVIFALLVSLAGIAHAACPVGAACLSWAPVMTDTNGKPLNVTVWYNVYRGAKGSSTKTLIRTTTPNVTADTEPAQPTGQQCYNVTAVIADPTAVSKISESVYSAEVCATFALAAPTDGSVEAPTDGSVTP